MGIGHENMSYSILYAAHYETLEYYQNLAPNGPKELSRPAHRVYDEIKIVYKTQILGNFPPMMGCLASLVRRILVRCS
jgi:hypothetical protein